MKGECEVNVLGVEVLTAVLAFRNVTLCNTVEKFTEVSEERTAFVFKVEK